MEHYFKRFRAWQPGEFVLLFVDTAAGGNDRVAGQFMSHRWLDVPEILHAHVTITAVTPLIHEELLSIYKQTSIRPIVCYERNNGGAFELERLSRLNRHGDYRIYTMQRLDSSGHLTDSGVMGWDTNTATRPKMLQELDDGLNSRLLHLYDRQTINEMFSFIVNPKNGKAEAEEGAHDDLVMSLAGVWQMYQTEKPEEDEQGGSVVETSPTGYNMRTVIDEALESSIVNVGDM